MRNIIHNRDRTKEIKEDSFIKGFITASILLVFVLFFLGILIPV